jgi:hypothetical protein
VGDFLISKHVPTGSGSHPASTSIRTCGHSRGQSGRIVTLTTHLPSTTEFETEWSYTSTSPLCPPGMYETVLPYMKENKTRALYRNGYTLLQDMFSTIFSLVPTPQSCNTLNYTFRNPTTLFSGSCTQDRTRAAQRGSLARQTCAEGNWFIEWN